MAAPSTTTLALCLAAAAATGCIEDSTFGLDAQPVELPRGVTHQLDLTSSAPLPPLTSLLLDVDDPTRATIELSPDQRHVQIRARAEGATVVHLTYRDTSIHIPTTILPAATVSIAIQPGGVTAPIGQTIALTALAVNTADEVVDVTPRAIWTIADPNVARLTSDGALLGMAAGTTSLRAEVDGVAKTAPVAVVPRS